LRVSSEEFASNYIKIFLFLKSHHFGKYSHLIFLYIIGYDIISWRLYDPHIPNLEGRDTPIPQD